MNIKKLDKNAIIPTRGSACAAGYDLYSCMQCEIPAGKTEKIKTGIAIELPTGYFGAIYARSGLAAKKGLRPANCVGVIDEDYRGEVIVALHNDSDEPQTISCGDRIAQLIIQPYAVVEIKEVDGLSETDRGSGGFGSTGAN